MVPPSTIRNNFLWMGIGSGSEPDMTPDLPMIYNLIDLGEISHHAVSGLDVATVEETWFAIQPLEGKAAYILVHPPGRVVRLVKAWTRLGDENIHSNCLFIFLAPFN